MSDHTAGSDVNASAGSAIALLAVLRRRRR
jgi:uncharacterized protein (TIGR03382 family)